MAERNAPKYSVQELKLSKENREELRDYISKEIDLCEGDRAGMIKKCRLWAEQANSRRQRPDARPRDSKVDMPLTKKRMLQNSSRLLNPIFQQDRIFVTKPRNPRVEDLARKVEDGIDYISDQINYRSICDSWIRQAQTFPLGAVKTPFIIETEDIAEWRELKGGFEDYNDRKLNGEPVIERQLDNGEIKYFIRVEETVPVRSGAFPEVIPFEDFLVPMNAVDVRTADWVAHRFWPTKKRLEDQINKGVYSKKDGDTTILDALGEPTAERDPLFKFSSGGKKNHSGYETSKQYEVFEIYLKWDVKNNGKPVEIIVTFEKSHKLILRAVYNFYHSYKRPFVTYNYEEVEGSIFGNSMAYILEPLHIANSASYNQRLDAASLANESCYRVPPGTAADIEEAFDVDSIRTSFIELNAEKDEVYELKLSQPYTQLPELEARLEKEADELSALSPYSFGNEQIDRPTASGQIQIIEESKQPQYMQLERFRGKLAEVCKHVLARYKQFYPEGLRYYKMQDPEGAQMIEQFFQWPEGTLERDILIETKVSSSSMSKNLRKQELVALVDKMVQLYNQMMQMAMAAVDPMNPSAMIAAQLLNGLWTVVNDMLTEFEVGKKEALNPRLVEVTQVAQQIQQQMQNLVQQVNQAGQANAQLQQQNAGLQAELATAQGLAPIPVPSSGVQGSMPMGAPAPGPGNQQMAQGQGGQ